MEIKVVVNCQYYENYNVGPDGFNTYGDGLPHWKPKGGYTFEMPIDSDVVMYCDNEVLVKAIKNLVEKENTIVDRFEYIDHEVVFSEPAVIEGLESEIVKLNELVS